MNKKHSDRHYDVWEKKTRCSSELIDQSMKKGTAQKREREKKRELLKMKSERKRSILQGLKYNVKGHKIYPIVQWM